MKIIGTCSLCSGRVVTRTHYHSVVPLQPQCLDCGAVARSHGPVIEMEKPTQQPTPLIEFATKAWG